MTINELFDRPQGSVILLLCAEHEQNTLVNALLDKAKQRFQSSRSLNSCAAVSMQLRCGSVWENFDALSALYANLHLSAGYRSHFEGLTLLDIGELCQGPEKRERLGALGEMLLMPDGIASRSRSVLYMDGDEGALLEAAEYLDFNGRLCVSLYEPAKDTGALDALLAQAQARCEGREAASLMRQTLIQLDGLQGFRPESFLNSLCPQGGLIRLPALQGALNDPLSYVNRVKRQNALRPAQTPCSARTIGFQSHTMGGM